MSCTDNDAYEIQCILILYTYVRAVLMNLFWWKGIFSVLADEFLNFNHSFLIMFYPYIFSPNWATVFHEGDDGYKSLIWSTVMMG